MSLYTDVVSDQLPAAISAVRDQIFSFNPSKIARHVLPEMMAFFRKYWAWALYFLVLRKLYRILWRSNKRARKLKKGKRSSVSTTDSNGTTESTENAPSSTDVAFLGNTAETTPAANQVLVGDGVIVVNRNDRYVEVYERKNIARVDNVDAEVEAMLKEFAARNQK